MQHFGITRGYIQGAFDGEGSFSKYARKDGVDWQIRISNTNLVWLDLISRYLKSRGYHPRIQINHRSHPPNRKPCYNLVIAKRAEIRRFLNEFPPLMQSRQKKAAEFLVWDKYSPRRLPKGSASILQQAFDILKDSSGQERLL